MVSTSIARVVVHLSLGIVVFGCNSGDEAEDTASTRSSLGQPAWLFNGYCGTAETGACNDARPDCPATPVAGATCDAVLTRCLGPATPEGLRKKFVCAETGKSVWGFNGYCGGEPGQACDAAVKTPCDVAGPAGQACATAGAKCTSGNKVFVCLPPAGNAWVLNAHCGGDTAGEKSCADKAVPLCPPAPVAGQACAVAGERCKTSDVKGKIFACVTR